MSDRPAAFRTGIIVAAIALAAAAIFWFTQSRAAAWGPALAHRELATRVLAEYAGAKHPNIVVVGNPFTQRSGQSSEIYAFEKASLRGLRKGLKSDTAFRIVYPELRREFLEKPESVYVDPNTTTPLSFLMSENAFDAIARSNPDATLILSLIGLPVNLQHSEVWRESSKKSFALLLPDWRMIGDQNAIRRAFQSGKIVAAVMSRPGAPPEDARAVGDDEAEFERRFVLVTRESIEALLQSEPRMF